MKLVVWTNLQSFVKTGLLRDFGLQEERISLSPIKGISTNKVANNIKSPSEAAEYKILLCCEKAASSQQIMRLLAPEEDYALALHASNSTKLLDLYCSFAEVCSGKLLYRAEFSEDSPTITLLQEILQRGHQPQLYQSYFEQFEKEARYAYRKNLLESICDTTLSPLLTNFPEKSPSSYLWNTLIEECQGIESLIKKYVMTISEADKARLLEQIEQKLF